MHCLLHDLPEMPFWCASGQRMHVPVVPLDECAALDSHIAACGKRVDLHRWLPIGDME